MTQYVANIAKIINYAFHIFLSKILTNISIFALTFLFKSHYALGKVTNLDIANCIKFLSPHVKTNKRGHTDRLTE